MRNIKVRERTKPTMGNGGFLGRTLP